MSPVLSFLKLVKSWAKVKAPEVVGKNDLIRRNVKGQGIISITHTL